MVAPTIGVLALQGAFAKHTEVIERLGYSSIEIRTVEELEQVDALIIPGGESTTISKLLDSSGLREPLATRLADGLPTFGTCAGMILLATIVLDGRDDQASFGVIDLTVKRNGYGRQINSFEADLSLAELGEAPLRAVFIRAPRVESVGEGVEVLASVNDVPVLCRQGSVLVSSFHPELTDDDRLHALFLAGLPDR